MSKTQHKQKIVMVNEQYMYKTHEEIRELKEKLTAAKERIRGLDEALCDVNELVNCTAMAIRYESAGDRLRVKKLEKRIYEINQKINAALAKANAPEP